MRSFRQPARGLARLSWAAPLLCACPQLLDDDLGLRGPRQGGSGGGADASPGGASSGGAGGGGAGAGALTLGPGGAGGTTTPPDLRDASTDTPARDGGAKEPDFRSQYEDDPPFQGRMLDFRVYSAALTAQHIQARFAAGSDAEW